MNDSRVTILRDFGEDLEYSNALSDEPVWADYYFRLFPDLAAAVKMPKDGPAQRHGIDRVLHFPSGLQLTVDEKKRRKDYGDILLELYSDFGRKTWGWTIDPNKLCDYVAYAIPVSGKCFFLPYPLLREAFRLYWRGWSDAYKKRRGKPFEDSQNEKNGRRWTTRNVPVKWGMLKEALAQQMHRHYSGDLALPVLKQVDRETNKDQLVLAFERTP